MKRLHLSSFSSAFGLFITQTEEASDSPYSEGVRKIEDEGTCLLVSFFTISLLSWSFRPSPMSWWRCCALVMEALCPSEESNTPITKISVLTALSQSRINIAQTQKTKRESENKQFNDVQQLAYVLGTEQRRSYSTNIITRVTKWSEDPN